MPFRPYVLAAALVLIACGPHTPAAPVLETPPPPAPTPVPPPPPTTPRVARGVGAGTGDGLEEHCPRTSPLFLSEVDAAINRVVDRHPELVDRDRRAGAGGFWGQDIDGFFGEGGKGVAAGA